MDWLGEDCRAAGIFCSICNRDEDDDNEVDNNDEAVENISE